MFRKKIHELRGSLVVPLLTLDLLGVGERVPPEELKQASEELQRAAVLIDDLLRVFREGEGDRKRAVGVRRRALVSILEGWGMTDRAIEELAPTILAVFEPAFEPDHGEGEQGREAVSGLDWQAEAGGLRPVLVQEYLRSRGFDIVEDRSQQGFVVYQRGEIAIDVPQHAEYADYARRMAEALEVLAAAEGLGPRELLVELSQPVVPRGP